MRSLNAYIDKHLVGELQEGDGLWRFTYDPGWAASSDGYDLAPELSRAAGEVADGGSKRPVQWYFDNLLPEELLRQAISREAGIKGDDAFALLQYLGAESAGSLTLLAPGVAPPDSAGYCDLPDSQLSRRIRALPRTTLSAGSPKRMSLAGAQHKLLVASYGGRLYEPMGSAPSTHILKPDHPDTAAYPASACNEYVTMKMAGAVGLAVAGVAIRYVPQPVYIIERFDRLVGERQISSDGELQMDVRRTHIIDACQLLSRDRLFKHSGASLHALNDIIARTTNKLHTRMQLFLWLAYNVATANDDCHLKNLSFHVAADGIKLARHYDLLATGAYYTQAFADERATWPDVPMAFPLPGARTFAEVTHESLLSAAGEIGLAPTTARRVLAQVLDRMPKALEQQTREMRSLHASLPEAARVHCAAQDRLLRVLDKMIVAPMLERMRC